VTGLLREEIIVDMHSQKAFLPACSGFSLESGMIDARMAEAQLTHKVIESSQQLLAWVRPGLEKKI
jgi:DeoR/GlpR family transcriptional regulator of sugar metabolism